MFHTGIPSSKRLISAHGTAGLWLQLLSLLLSKTTSKQSFPLDSALSVPMTCREKGGSQSTVSEYIGYRAIMDFQNAFFGECFSHLPGTEMGMLKFVLEYLSLVLQCEPSGM